MKSYKFPLYGFIGIGLIIVSWYLNWTLDGLRTHIGFFPLWFGYILFIDASVYYLKGTSLIHRGKTKFIQLFLFSAPVWWLFELFNLSTRNWQYLGRENFSDLEYFVLASFSFSTVMPAVFETVELTSMMSWIKKIPKGLVINDSRKTLLLFLIFGTILLILIILLPGYFFPFIWISLYFVIEPINVQLKNQNLLSFLKTGNWQPIVVLSIGALLCGFFWEMWNYYSYPKWMYTIPFVNFLHIFEMPLLGYIGYPPFALELYAIYHLLTKFLKIENDNYLILY